MKNKPDTPESFEGISGTIAHAVVMTADQNKHPRESALLTLAWIAHCGGDYKKPLDKDFPEAFRASCDSVAGDFAAIVKQTNLLKDDEQISVPLAVKKDNVEGFVLEMCGAIGLHPAVAMQILGVIAYADGNLKKHIHLPTLAAHTGKEAARYGYQVDLQAAEDVPLNITGAIQ